MAKRNTFSEDELYEEKFDINQLKRLLHYIKPYRGQFVLVAVLMLNTPQLLVTYLPILMISGVVTGVLTGIVAQMVMKHLKTIDGKM